MIAPEEWRQIPLEARLVEHASHTEDELLREDLIAAVAKIDRFAERIADLSAEILRLERIAASPTPY
jgi:hypothetical protein